jgi:hypothetical protein
MEKPNLVAIATWSRTGASASPTSSSFVNGPYTSAERDSALDGGPDQLDHLAPVRKRREREGHPHASEAECRDFEASERSLFHRVSFQKATILPLTDQEAIPWRAS